jgi:hypothetical protein
MLLIEKTLITAFSLIVIFFIGCAVFLILAFGARKETVKIKNHKNDENIFLIHTSWSNHDRMAIGLDRKLRGGFGFLYPEKYNSDSADPILYKLSNDTLYNCSQYKTFNPPVVNHFRTKIILIEHADSLIENSIYKKMGFKVFPGSVSHPFENNDISPK